MAWEKVVFAGSIISLLTEASNYCNQTIQYYDADRNACLDRCGSYNELKCRVDEVCSSNVPWGTRVQPPACMNQCPMLCKDGRYCNHEQNKCLPCSSLCSAYDKSACRVFCYDFFKALPARFADPRDCETNQYFDNDRRVCLDQCGADDETKCQVDQFCSSKITWSTHYDPPVCVSHCNELCDGDTYCDHISQSCMPCDTLCTGPDKQACRIHCYDMFLSMTAKTSSAPDTRATSEEATSLTVLHVTIYQQVPTRKSDVDDGMIVAVVPMVIASICVWCLIAVGVIYIERSATKCPGTTKGLSQSKQVDTANGIPLLSRNNSSHAEV